MKHQSEQYLPNRVLKLNVGFLLDGQTRSRDMDIDVPRVRVDDDLFIDYLNGSLRLSRTKEGILVQGTLTAGVQGDCYRCLEEIQRPITFTVEELFATSNDLSVEDAEFRILDDGQLNLAPLIRAEILIQTAHAMRCEDRAACDARMKTLEEEAGIDHLDPRMARLKELLQSDSDH